jgi:hypothetical protein
MVVGRPWFAYVKPPAMPVATWSREMVLTQ